MYEETNRWLISLEKRPNVGNQVSYVKLRQLACVVFKSERKFYFVATSERFYRHVVKASLEERTGRKR